MQKLFLPKLFVQPIYASPANIDRALFAQVSAIRQPEV